MPTPRERAVKLALKELADWHAPVYPPERLKTIIKNAVEYGYQAATMDMDARKRGVKCSLKSTTGHSQT
jgi:hypothetical protein